MMSEILYKASRPDGWDFRTGGTLDYGTALASGAVLLHPRPGGMIRNNASTYISLSSEPGEVLTGGSFPCRLFMAEPSGEVITSDEYTFKRCVKAVRIIRELPSWQALGPNGKAAEAVLSRLVTLTADEATRLRAARDAARDAAWNAARSAAWKTARDAARSAAWDAAWKAAWDTAWNAAWGAARSAAWNAAGDAILAHLTRDLISEAQFQVLAGPWISVTGDVT